MAYQIEYAYTCHIGKIRNNNEDNFWCCGDSLEAQNQGMSHIRSGYMKQSEYPLQKPVANILKLQKMEYGMIRKNS